jgi:hypothetical protein
VAMVARRWQADWSGEHVLKLGQEICGSHEHMRRGRCTQWPFRTKSSVHRPKSQRMGLSDLSHWTPNTIS